MEIESLVSLSSYNVAAQKHNAVAALPERGAQGRRRVEVAREIERDQADVHDSRRRRRRFQFIMDMPFRRTPSPAGHWFCKLEPNPFRVSVDVQFTSPSGKSHSVPGFYDEGRPEHQRAAWWAAYLAGGVWEAHVLGPYDRPMSAWEPVWAELAAPALSWSRCRSGKCTRTMS